MDVIFDQKLYIYVADTQAAIYSIISNIYGGNALNAGGTLIDTIVTGTESLDETLLDGNIAFGNLFASKFECTVYNVADISGKFIHVFERKGGDSIPVFTGLVDSCKKDKLNDDRRLIAYDPAYYLGNINVATWYENFFGTLEEGQTVTLKQTRESLVSFVGITNPTGALLNDSITVSKTLNLSSGSFAAVMKMLCEISCVFPHFNRKGQLEYITLSNPTTHDLSDAYEWSNSAFEEYETAAITGVLFTNSEDETKQTIGTDVNPYTVSQNAFLYDKRAEGITEVGNAMFDAIRNIKYTPAELKMIVGSFDYELGDKVTTNEGDFYIFQIHMDGPLFVEQTLTAKGDPNLGDSYKSFAWESAVFNERYSKIVQTVDEIGLIVQGLDTSAGIIARINQDDVSEVKIWADRINFEGSATFMSWFTDNVTRIAGGTIITETIYADTGIYAEIVVDELITTRRIKKYLEQDKSDDNYVHIHDATVSLVKGFPTNSKTEGIPESQWGVPPVQAKNTRNEFLYWDRDITGATIIDGVPYIDDEPVTMSTTETEYPVMIYNYVDDIVAEFAFDNNGNGEAALQLGDVTIKNRGTSYAGLHISVPWINQQSGIVTDRTASIDIGGDDGQILIDDGWNRIKLMGNMVNIDPTSYAQGAPFIFLDDADVEYPICPVIPISESDFDPTATYPAGFLIAVLEDAT